MDLDQLIASRQALNSSLAVHEASIQAFWPQDKRPGFVIDFVEFDDLPADTGGKPLHLTSSASCFESLADREPGLSGRLPKPTSRDAPAWPALAAAFATRALETQPDQWLSDGAAHVYCRVRALPAVLRFAPRPLKPELRRAARDRLSEAFSVVDTDRPLTERGLGERILGDRGRPDPKDTRYRANTFHAYWGVKAHRGYEQRRGSAGDLPVLSKDHQRRVETNSAWAQGAMAWQTALLLGEKPRGDAQQLAFALLADLLSHNDELVPASSRFDLYHAALKAFFAAQEPTGRWPQSAPLFYYPHSGNAYCYTYETLAELLRPALSRETGRVYRSMLKPYLVHLFRAWDYAMQTRIPLVPRYGERAEAYGWCSNHHLTRSDPEVWATAESFAYGQLLRCVSGHIVAELCETELRARPPSDSPEVAARTLGDRGATWAADSWTVGRQLAAMFLHPTRLSSTDDNADRSARDPDAPLIAENRARSAVLFGPPGTSKTTLVEALAGALGWQFVEILASDFLSGGVDAVPARADLIFDRLMQMNRCVVLFDEIDELIRDRSNQQSDPFGRFLTTSMLPKIAKLWKQRRIMFFVATNHVKQADPAITRSSRFDARIFVAPPGLATKKRQLRDALGEVNIDEKAILTALTGNEPECERLSPQQQALAVLPLLRFDQTPELIRAMQDSTAQDQDEKLYDALAQMRDRLLAREWKPTITPAGWSKKSPDWQLRHVYDEFMKDHSRDESRQRVMILDKEIAGANRKWRRIATRAGWVFVEAPDALPAEDAEGELSFESNGRRVSDRGFVHFAAIPPAGEATAGQSLANAKGVRASR